MRSLRRKLKTAAVVVSVVSAILAYLLRGHILKPPDVMGDERHSFIEHVIDGDTAVVQGGERVRYLGINTPEKGEPFYREAALRNSVLVKGKRVRLSVCKGEPKDRYGRTLALVYADGVLVNRELLKDGLARTLFISPCSTAFGAEFLEAERDARARGKGVWSSGGRRETPGEEDTPGPVAPATQVISPVEAKGHAGEKVIVKGRVVDVKRARGAIFLNFGQDYRRSFTAVIFRKDFTRFEREGAGLLTLKGREVSVRGVVRIYGERAEVIVKRPSEISVEGD